jgi:hypothetical protein
MALKNFFYYASIAILLWSCGSSSVEHENSSDDSRTFAIVDSILDSKFPTDLALVGNNLKITMDVPVQVFYYKEYTELVRELALYDITEYLNNIETVEIATEVKAMSEPNDPVIEKDIFSKSKRLKLIAFNLQNKACYDFKRYIFDNIDGEDQYNYYGVILGIYKIRGLSDQKVPSYVKVIIDYGKELDGLIPGQYNQSVLEQIKAILTDMPELGINSASVDYFLNYNKAPR